MSVFTHGVNKKDKPRMVDRNQVFPVAEANKSLTLDSPTMRKMAVAAFDTALMTAAKCSGCGRFHL
jgi:hypothetical protein